MAQMPMPNQDMWVPNNQVRAIAVDGDFTYIGGDFTYVGPHNGFGTQVDKSTGLPAINFPRINGKVNSSLPDGSGGWYIGGQFDHAGDVERYNMVHIKADGSVDNIWKPQPDGEVTVMVRDDNYLYIGGYFQNIDEKIRQGIARINLLNGYIDDGWNPGADNAVMTIQIDESNVYLGGYFRSIGGKVRNYLARTNKIDGGVDSIWNPNAGGYVMKILKEGNDIYVAGNFHFIGGATRNGLAKLNSHNGASEIDWICNADSQANLLAIDNDKLYVGGWFNQIGGYQFRRLARLNLSTGNVDTSWKATTLSIYSIRAITVDADYIYIGGQFNRGDLSSRKHILRLSKVNAAVDESFNLEAEWDVESIVINDNKIFVGGWFKSIGGKLRNKIARINNITGALDTLWNPNVETYMQYAYVYAIAVDENAVYFGGDFRFVNGDSCKNLAKVNKSDGKLDALWKPNPNGKVVTMELNNGFIYVGGSFTSIGGQMVNGLSKLNSIDGTPINQWNPNPDYPNIDVIKVDGNQIYVSGRFETIGGQPRRGLARVDNTIGTADTSWNPNTHHNLYADAITIAIDDSDVFIGGYFHDLSGTGIKRLAKISKTTGLINTYWNPNPNDYVTTITIEGNYLFIGGNFTAIGGQARNRLAKLDKSNGNLDLIWNPECGNYVQKILMINDDIYVVGAFTSFNGKWRPHLALFTNRILPVELTSFKGEIINNNVQLDWTTATENNSHRFVIEKNFNSEWRPIGYINASGNSTTPRSYRFIDEISDASALTYRLKIVDFDGSYEYSSTISLNINHAFEYSLDQNYPNPFNPSTTIKFGLPNDTKVVLEVFNFLGERVATLLNQEMTSGYHQVNFDGSNLSSGVYIYRLSAGEFSSVKKFTLLK
jgi:hypothetical protein